MIDRRRFCSEFGLDEDAVAKALARGSETPAPSAWLIDAVLALAAWITAIGILAFFAVAFELLWHLSEPIWVHAMLGAAIFFAGVALTRSRTQGIYRSQFGVAVAAAGTALWVAGVAVPHNSLILAAVAAAIPAIAVIVLAAPRGLQLLTSGLLAGLAVVSIWDARLAHGIDLLALATVVGTGLLIRPPRLDLRPSAMVLLLTLPVAATLPDFFGHLNSDGWGARIIHAALVATLAWKWSRRGASGYARYVTPVLAAAVALVMPAGGSAAMVMLALAGLLGSWPLAAIGAVAQVVFLWRFYADLQFNLLTKSAMLVAVGLLLIAVWIWISRRSATESRV